MCAPCSALPFNISTMVQLEWKVFIFLSHFVSFYYSFISSIWLFFNYFLSTCLIFYLSLFICLFSICLLFWLSLYLYVSFSIYLFFNLSLFLYASFSMCLFSIPPFISPTDLRLRHKDSEQSITQFNQHQMCDKDVLPWILCEENMIYGV